MSYTVYAIRHLSNGWTYFGCTGLAVKLRWQIHRAALRGGNHACKPLQQAWNRDGEDEFVFERLRRFPTKKAGMNYEWSLIHRPEGEVYNVLKRGWTSVSSEERSARNREQWSDPEFKARTRAAISASRKGQSRGPHSPETRAKIAAANRARAHLQVGVPLSEETKQKLSESHKGKVKSKETRAKISEGMRKAHARRQLLGL